MKAVSGTRPAPDVSGPTRDSAGWTAWARAPDGNEAPERERPRSLALRRGHWLVVRVAQVRPQYLAGANRARRGHRDETHLPLADSEQARAVGVGPQQRPA